VFRISYVFQGFKSKTRFIFAIVEKESGQFIGEAGLHLDNNKKIAQLSYWIGESFWNQGAATEAVSSILQFGLNTLQLDLIFAECHINNSASEKVMVKTGMLKKGTNGNVVQYVIKR
jgi:RimJ/RimL family protein N-acetyltransferase